MQEAATWFLLAGALASLLLLLVSHVSVRVHRRGRPNGSVRPPISVLKPLKGTDDPELWNNLVSLAMQDYPEFELILGCEDVTDPALSVARRLQREFPDVPVRIVAGAAIRGYNPKVNNLRNLVTASRHDWILISDADVRVDPGYLRALASELEDPNVGLVSSVIAGSGERSLGAVLENQHLNGFIAASVCCAQVLAHHPCVVGKSMLFRQQHLRELGGWDLIKDKLAEDYVLGAAFKAAGYRVALSPHCVRAINTDRSVSAFWKRHVRWNQMRRRIVPFVYCGEPLMMPAVWCLGLLGLVAVSPDGFTPIEKNAVSVAAFGLMLRLASDALLTRHLRGSWMRPADQILVLAKDLVALGMWLVGGFSRTVLWRGTALRIGQGSELSPVGSLASAEEPVLDRAA